MMVIDFVRPQMNLLLLAGCVAIVCPEVWGDEPQPLARCDLQLVTAETNIRPNTLVTPDLVAGAESEIVNYRRGPSGDWEVPLVVDRNDPHVRLLLATPAGPLLVELAVYVDASPFREIREEWIDEVLRPTDSQGDSVAEPPETSDGDRPTEVTDALAKPADDETSPAASSNIEASAHRRSAARNRLERYVSRSRIGVQRDEARWLLSQWVPGPAVLEVKAGFAAERALMAPLWAMLDEDGDREVSRSEAASATERLRRRDVDEDDWVDSNELTSGISPVVRDWTPRPLFTLLSESTDWKHLGRQLSQLYDAKTGRPMGPLLERRLQDLGAMDFAALSAEDLARLTTMTPDVAMRVDLGDEARCPQGVAVLSLRPPLLARGEPLAPAKQVITLRLDGCDVEFTAAQTQTAAADVHGTGQIAVGAVLDGSPLLRLIDADRDERLSLRECDAVPSVLEQLDENGDGALSSREVPVPIRLTVTLGPHAHQVLSAPSRAPLIARATKVTAPDWFVGMDTNQDNDLTPGEFLGTKQQFAQLDNDANGRVSAREASAAAPP